MATNIGQFSWAIGMVMAMSGLAWGQTDPGPRAVQIEIQERAAAHVVAVAFEEAVRVAVDGLNVIAVDLEAEGGGRGPDQ